MPLLRSVVLAAAAALTLAHDELAKGKDVAKLKIDEIEAKMKLLGLEHVDDNVAKLKKELAHQMMIEMADLSAVVESVDAAEKFERDENFSENEEADDDEAEDEDNGKSKIAAEKAATMKAEAVQQEKAYAMAVNSKKMKIATAVASVGILVEAMNMEAVEKLAEAKFTEKEVDPASVQTAFLSYDRPSLATLKKVIDANIAKTKRKVERSDATNEKLVVEKAAEAKAAEAKAAEAKAAEAKAAEAKAAEAKAAVAKAAEGKAAEAKVTAVKVAEANVAAAKIAEAKVAAAKAAEAKAALAGAKVAIAKATNAKASEAADTKAEEVKTAAIRTDEVKATETTRAALMAIKMKAEATTSKMVEMVEDLAAEATGMHALAAASSAPVSEMVRAEGSSSSRQLPHAWVPLMLLIGALLTVACLAYDTARRKQQGRRPLLVLDFGGQLASIAPVDNGDSKTVASLESMPVAERV